MQVADLAAADPKAELAALAQARFDSRPGGDLCGDLLARCQCLGHLSDSTVADWGGSNLQPQVHLKSSREKQVR
jgi:hypothetical protein